MIHDPNDLRYNCTHRFYSITQIKLRLSSQNLAYILWPKNINMYLPYDWSE